MSKEIRKTSIGGQAVIEGIMMRGVDKTCLAVRNPQGEIVLEDVVDKAMSPSKYKKIPVLRGIVNFVASLMLGFKTIDRSAEIAMGGILEEEETKFDKWIKAKFGDKAEKVITVFTVVLAIIMALGMFVLIPYGIAWLLELALGSLGVWFHVIEGITRIGVFLCYVLLVRRMPDMKRLFGYHGAEHKTIHCYEHGEELTIENVKKHSCLHKRCGTNFLLIVMIISILVFSLINVEHALLRLGLRLLLIPIVAGISYEIIKLLGRYDNKFTDILSFPGLCLQKLTTNEPDDDQLEVGIASLKYVLPANQGEDDKW